MPEQFGKLLKNIRLESGHDSLGELSRLSGISVATLSRIESGVQHPSPDTIRKLAPFLPKTTYESLMVAAGYLQTGYSLTADREPRTLRESSLEEDYPELAKVLRRNGRTPTLAERRRIAKIIELAIEDTDDDE